MKKISLVNLMNLVSQLENDKNDQYCEVINNTIIVKDRELNGDEMVLNEVSDFGIELSKYIDLCTKISKYKSIIAKTNANTISEITGKSIIDMINEIKQYKNILATYDTLLSKKPSLKRCFDGNGGSSFYKVTELNFDTKQIQSDKDFVIGMIMKYENEINNLNANTMVEIS